jgi:hypothetical protein
MTPKIYLVSRDITPEQRDEVLRALSITPLAAVIVADPRDINQAIELCRTAEVLHQPIAILAGFENPLTAVNEDGSLCPLLSPSKT